MNDPQKAVRIFGLIALSILLFIPIVLTASLEDEIKAAIQTFGYSVKEMSDVPVLTPDSDMTFEIRNKGSLHNGKNEIYIDLLYKEKQYSTVTMTMKLDGRPSLTSSKTGSVLHPVSATAKRFSYALMKSGEKVSVIYKANGLTIRTEGRVLQDAGRSEEVEVMLLPSNRKVTGVVRDRKTVLVKEEGENP